MDGMANPNHQLFNNMLLLMQASWEVSGDGSMPTFLYHWKNSTETHLIDSGSQKSLY